MNHTQIYCHPIVAHEQVYTVQVFTNKRLKNKKFHLIVTDQEQDLKYRETDISLEDAMQRIKQLEFELILEGYTN